MTILVLLLRHFTVETILVCILNKEILGNIIPLSLQLYFWFCLVKQMFNFSIDFKLLWLQASLKTHLLLQCADGIVNVVSLDMIMKKTDMNQCEAI